MSIKVWRSILWCTPRSEFSLPSQNHLLRKIRCFWVSVPGIRLKYFSSPKLSQFILKFINSSTWPRWALGWPWVPRQRQLDQGRRGREARALAANTPAPWFPCVQPGLLGGSSLGVGIRTVLRFPKAGKGSLPQVESQSLGTPGFTSMPPQENHLQGRGWDND